MSGTAHGEQSQVPTSEADTSRAHDIDSTLSGGPRLPPTSYRCHESNRQRGDTSRAHDIDSTPGGGPLSPPPPTGATSRIVRQVPASEADTSRAHHIDSTPGGGPLSPPPPTGATSRIVR
ncbi:hypothetical protein BJ912DRAFT_1060640 [Pholiota molesta]|nr:hypothetical protein BJ912DRAFT_1060640 [Pholiota molesta]